MRRIDQYERKTCWIDVFEKSFLGGTMRRVFGPRQLDRLSAGSVIVGPAAQLSLTCRHDNKRRDDTRRGIKPAVVTLKANRVIPDLSKITKGAVIRAAQIDCISKRR